MKKLIGSKTDIIRKQRALWKIAVRYSSKHILEIEIFVGAALCFVILSKFPYLNLIFSKYTILFLLIVLGTFLFHISKRIILTFALLCFLIAALATIWGRIDDAEMMGNFIYALVLFVCIVFMRDNIMEES